MTNPNTKDSAAVSEVQTSIAPWLTVSNAARAVAFYKAAFEAEETYRLEGEDGGLVVQLLIGSAAFWVSSDAVSEKSLTGEVVGGGSVRMILTVTDPDTIFERALAAGASQIFPVGEGHGWRLGRLEDPFGLHWEIGRQLSQE